MRNINKYQAKIFTQNYLNNKSIITDTKRSCVGVLYSMWMENEILNFNKSTKEFYFVTNFKVAVVESDILEIENQKYRVKALETTFLSTRKKFKKLLLVKDENNF